MVEILCPCPKNDLEQLVNFLYGGELQSLEAEFDAWKIIENLIKIFGFSKDIRKNCLIKESDVNDSLNISDNIEEPSETNPSQNATLSKEQGVRRELSKLSKLAI